MAGSKAAWLALTDEQRERHAGKTKALYDKLIGPLREVAQAHGYALAVHGTLVRDIDLIACPWTRQATEPHVLATAIGEKVRELNGGIGFQLEAENSAYFLAGCPGAKAHQRLGWVWHLGGGPYIDLSVMPRVPDLDMTKFDLDAAGKIPPTNWASA